MNKEATLKNNLRKQKKTTEKKNTQRNYLKPEQNALSKYETGVQFPCSHLSDVSGRQTHMGLWQQGAQMSRQSAGQEYRKENEKTQFYQCNLMYDPVLHVFCNCCNCNFTCTVKTCSIQFVTASHVCNKP